MAMFLKVPAMKTPIRPWTFADKLAPAGAWLLALACSGCIEDYEPPPPDAGQGGDAGSSSAVGGAASAEAGRGGGGRGGAGPGGGAGQGTAGAAVVGCSQPSPGTAPLRRLSNAEYRNTLNDLFSTVSGFGAVVAEATRDFPAEAESLGFRNNAAFLTVQALTAKKYLDAAELIAERAAKSPGVVACAPTVGKELACGSSFIADFGRRAFRRPLQAEEATRLEALFQRALESYGFDTAVEWVIFSVLQSPAFLYRVELGEPTQDPVTRPLPVEMASRLSYLFWQSAPDGVLLQAAEDGQLETPEQLEAQARRLLADARSERLFQYFAEWLDIDVLDDFSRDAATFPALPSNLPELYARETQTFVQSLLSRPDGSFGELVSAPYTFANKALATHYGLTGATGNTFVRVAAPERSGVLTQAMLLVHDKPYRTSIVRRGLKLRTDFLCQLVPAPPNDVSLDLEALSPDLSQRERLEQHRANPSCAGCHALLDPLGLVFENFDAVGRFRSKDEAGRLILAESEIGATRDLDGSVSGARELGVKLAESAEARDCYVTQTFRFFFGRDVEPADACSMAELRAAFERSELSISELLVALTKTDAFMYRPITVKEAP